MFASLSTKNRYAVVVLTMYVVALFNFIWKTKFRTYPSYYILGNTHNNHDDLEPDLRVRVGDIARLPAFRNHNLVRVQGFRLNLIRVSLVHDPDHHVFTTTADQLEKQV